MAGSTETKRLSAVLIADIAGYTRLIEADTDKTVEAWKDARSTVIDPQANAFSGRIVKYTGDGFLAEFGSVQNAVECALHLQEELATSILSFRVGIGLGDIVDDGRDIHGEGVNIAARIEALAEPGSVYISGAVYDAVKNRVACRFEDKGEHKVKNVSSPVRVFSLGEPTETAKPGMGKAKPSSRPPFRLAIAALAVCVTVFLGYETLRPTTDNKTIVSTPAQQPKDKPSIVVLPFENVTNDSTQDYFADGLTKTITTNLSRFPQLFVVSSITAFSNTLEGLTVTDVGETLGVRYALQGSVHKGSQSIALNVQLVDTQTTQLVWSEEYNVAPDEWLDAQSTLVARIVGTLWSTLDAEAIDAVARREPGNLEAYDLYLKAVHASSGLSKDGEVEAIALLLRAIETDPDLLEAHYEIGSIYLSHWRFRNPEEPDKVLNQARHHADKVLQIDRSDYRGHYLLGKLALFADHDHDLALSHFNRTLELNANDANVAYFMGFLKSLIGEAEEAIDWNNQAKLLNPRYPAWYDFNAALSHFLVEDYETALTLARSGKATYPKSLAPRRIIIATLAEMDRMDEAREEVEEYLALGPDFRLSTFKNTPFKHTEDQERYFNAMRKAGIPD